jgi:hypothetical protein
MKLSSNTLNTINKNLHFKTLAGPRELDLDRRGLDENPITFVVRVGLRLSYK